MTKEKATVVVPLQRAGDRMEFWGKPGVFRSGAWGPLFAAAFLLATMTTVAAGVTNDAPAHMKQAKESFLKKDTAAAREMKKAAKLLAHEGEKAGSESKEGLKKSADEIGKLADEVGKGTVKDAESLDRAFGRASHALANAHFTKASEAWAKKDAKRTGRELKEAADHMDRAAEWTGKEAKDDTLDAARDARTVGGKLAQGAGWTADEVGKSMTSFGSALEKLGRRAKS